MHTQICLTPAGVWAFTCCRLGFHFFGEALWEWLTLCPNIGLFPQTSHCFGMIVLFKGLLYTTNGPSAQDYQFRLLCGPETSSGKDGGLFRFFVGV